MIIVALDCNIWITLAINRQLDFLYYIKQKFQIAACPELLYEIKDVLSRPKFEKYFSKKDTEDILQAYLSITDNYQLSIIESVVSDEDDNYLFALCKISKASYLVTGDKLLQAEEFYHTTSIIPLAELRVLIAP